ncbi:TonB-dependent receptor [Nitrogeniibacter aestuarii]|uniref:TonB-dependent receptor n=1 Tax=Nitrogeniibacter aestuarii TaxID=2815343 RepID=UPI001D114AC6|nr:TonB-dependent siderophore receptor [Nitrogeniibacter aestuarii]
MTQQKSAISLPASFRVAAKPLPGTMTRTALALGVTTTMFTPLAVAQSTESTTTLAPVEVVSEAIDPNPNAEPGAPYKARTSGDERHTRPLAETPQTITVLTRQQMLDTGRTDLRDILRAQPGITLGTGENGNAFGDRYIIRGQEARSDVFVDGLRDPGMTVRESFAVEQLEITKGPSSTFAGRGATGGAINSITKQATTDVDFTKLSVGFGTDSYVRMTADSNFVINEDNALRINLLHHRQDVPDRSPANRGRDGVALSWNLQATDKLDLTADYYHLKTDEQQDLGTWTLDSGKPATNIPVYVQDEDFLKSEIDTFTLRARYYLDDKTRITNLTRYGTTDNGYVITGANDRATHATNPGGVYNTVSLSTHQGWQEVEYFANQTNLYAERNLWGMDHEFIFSLEYSDHSVLNGQYDYSANSNCVVSGRGGSPRDAVCIVDPSGNYVNNIGSLLDRSISKGDADIDWNAKTISLSAMDTIDLTEEWTLFGGLRYDHVDLRTVTGTTTKTKWELDDGLWNGHLGLTWQFKPDANVYVTYSTASDINGGESDVSSCDYGGICVPSTGAGGVALTTAQRQALFAQSEPEKSENIEVGTKWNVNRGKLLLTAAWFQVTKSDVMEIIGGQSYTDIGAINTGKYRVQGVELGMAGNLTQKLSAQAGMAVMNAKWLKSQDQSRVDAGLSNFPETTASVLLSYAATPKFTFGGNVTYQGRKYSGTPESPEQLTVKVPDYTVLDLFASYRFNRNLSARLNVGNVTDETYYLSAYRSGAFMYLGDARNAQLTFNYDF